MCDPGTSFSDSGGHEPESAADGAEPRYGHSWNLGSNRAQLFEVFGMLSGLRFTKTVAKSQQLYMHSKSLLLQLPGAVESASYTGVLNVHVEATARPEEPETPAVPET